MLRARNTVLRNPWLVIAVVALATVGWWAAGTRRQPHHLRAAFDGAVSVVPGLRVNMDGIEVGKVSSVDLQDGKAIVGLGIADDHVWPLHRGTTATIRFGTTIGNGTREIDITPGPASAPAIADGGIVDSASTVTPVEIDQLFSTFDAPTRRHLRGMLAGTAGALDGRAAQLSTGVHETPAGLEAAGGVMADLAADEYALRGLVRDGDRAMTAVADHKAAVSDLVTVAAATFATFASRTRAVQESIDGLAPTLREARGTLARLDGSVGTLHGLVTALRPGARDLVGLSTRLRPAVASLSRTLPSARATVATATSSAPAITELLRRGAPFMGRLAPVLEQAGPMLGCVRPYTPEIAGFLTNWTGFTKNYDATAHYARIHVRGGATSVNGTPASSAQIASVAGPRYAMPRPPGLNAGQPWLLGHCGAAASALDAARDPEAGR